MTHLAKIAPPTAHIGRLLLTLLLMLLTTSTAWADNVTLTSSTTSWTGGNTYVTNGDVNIADRITVTGNVTLKLTDGYTLTAPNGIEVRKGNSLTIEGGTNGTGTLTIEGGTRAGIGGGYKKSTYSVTYLTQYGDITINGGIVNVQGANQCAGIGGDFNSELTDNGTITINGGVVNATGGTGAAGIGGGCGSKTGAYGGCGAIVINGGQVTATGGGDGPGIGPGKDVDDNTSGSLVLGWTNTSDIIQVTGVKSNVTAYGFSHRLKSISIADGKKFNLSGGDEEATTDNIKNKVSLKLIPKGSEQYQLSVATISGISASYNLTGSDLYISFSVSDAKKNTLTLGTDYTATLGTTSQESTTIHITEGGKYTLTINGKGSYTGSKSIDFEVISIGFKKDANGVDYINMPKNGIKNATIPSGVSSFKVYDDGGAKAKYSNSCNGGLVLIAPDNHVLQLTGTVTAEVVENKLYDYLMVYDGGSTSAQKIGDKYGSESGENIGTLISSGTQMTLTFHSDNNGPKDGLDLTATLKRDIRSCDIANIDDQPYTGSAFEPAVVITYEGSALVKDVDYEVTYSANTIVGTATITITGKGNYAKTTSKTFNIVKATPTVSAPAAVENLVYDGSALALVNAGTTDFGTLLYSTDGNNYSKDIPTATNAGTYTVYYKVAGDANHNDVSGSIEVTIAQKAVTSDDITITIPSQTYTGGEISFDGTAVVVKDGETELTENTDYTVTAPSGPIQDSGNYTYTITGQGNYAGSREAMFTITPRLARQYGAVYLYEDQNGQTALLDGTSVDPVDIPSDDYITVNHVTSNRTFTPGKASTVMLPFNYTCNGEEGGTFYKFVDVKKVNNQWVATMQETGNDANKEGKLIANTPYLFMPIATEMTFPNIPSKGVTLCTEEGGKCETADEGCHWTFKGTYEYKEWISGGANAEEIGRAYGFAGVAKDDIDVGDFVRVASGAKILPMRAYLIWNGKSNSNRAFTRGAADTDEELPKSITVRLVGSVGGDDEQTTAIGTLDTETGEIDFSGWYDMSGHKLSGKPTKKGIYINNGRKVVVK
ncbi:CUB domain-containing protein [Prevotella sp. MA2016]|uniref:CUB domain-containing protein n=1 Tax=Prevotella sp. MA2016 TaxID=1408310 RepID=UPI0018CC1070|nr:CUB domain-containing protein [Prevotella sp. MA2016]